MVLDVREICGNKRIDQQTDKQMMIDHVSWHWWQYRTFFTTETIWRKIAHFIKYFIFLAPTICNVGRTTILSNHFQACARKLLLKFTAWIAWNKYRMKIRNEYILNLNVGTKQRLLPKRTTMRTRLMDLWQTTSVYFWSMWGWALTILSLLSVFLKLLLGQ